jgi:uncharacterized repeat protein (TIGR02543 family)
MTKTGHAFGGWYKEEGLTNQWNFSTDTVTGDITLYARWIPTYTVSGTIYTDDPAGGASGASVRLKRGGANAGSAVSTGADGAYTIRNVPAGEGYTIEVSLSGYATGSISSFDITADVTGKDLTLIKLTAGYKTTYTGDGVSFKTAWVPGGITFPTGTNDSGTVTVANA